MDTEEGHRQIEQYKESYINVQDFFDLSQTVFPFIFSAPMGIFSYLLSVNSLIHGISAIHRNLDLPKLKTLNRVKLILSAFFLSLNVSFEIKNLV